MSATDVVVGNVVIGHGHLKVDGVSVGAISGGLSITKGTDVYEIYVDQLKTPIRQIPVKETFAVKTNLAETTLTNLALVWNIPDSKHSGTPGAAGETLKIGVSTGVVEHTLEITGVAPNGRTRVIQVHRAVSLTQSEFTYIQNKETLFPITFVCLADTSYPNGEEIATIVDVAGEL